MKINLASSVELDKDVTIAVDSSGIKVSNQGEWIRKKWKVKRSFIKVYIAVDTKTKQILAIEVTKEDVGDGRMLKRLVDGSASKAVLSGVIADGAYDSKSNFRMFADMGIDPLIRVRRNASFKGGDCMPRKFAVVEQLGNAGWRKERGYGYLGWLSQRSHA